MPFKQLAASSGEMQKLIDHHPGNLNFTGLLERSNVVPYFQAADLFFLPSAQETFGIVIVEAAAAGLPVLLRDLQQYHETFGDNFVVGNDVTFTSIIHRFQTDNDYYQMWKQKSKNIAERYDAPAGAQRLVEIYSDVLNRKAIKHNKKNGARA